MIKLEKVAKVQQTSEYFVDGIALVLATLITYLVFGKGLHRILLYTADEWKSYCFMLFVAYSAIAVGFASSIDLAKRQRIMELLAVLRNCSLTYMSFAVLLLVFKNPMIDSVTCLSVPTCCSSYSPAWGAMCSSAC